jgi:hypothetical protein
MRSALARIASLRFAARRSAPLSLTPTRIAALRFAPLRSGRTQRSGWSGSLERCHQRFQCRRAIMPSQNSQGRLLSRQPSHPAGSGTTKGTTTSALSIMGASLLTCGSRICHDLPVLIFSSGAKRPPRPQT